MSEVVHGAAEQEACPLPGWEEHEGAGVGKPKFPLCALHLTHVVSGECLTHLCGGASSPNIRRGEELLKSSLTRLRMGSAGVERV